MDKYITLDGYYKYGIYVNIENIPSALILANSIKKTGTLLLLIGITESKSSEEIFLLRQYYDIITSQTNTDKIKKKYKLEEIYSITNDTIIYNNIDDLLINKMPLNILKDVYDKKSNGITYIKIKPYIFENNLTLEERTTINEYNIYFYYFYNMINENMYINNISELKEITELASYFIEAYIKNVYVYTNNTKISDINKQIMKMYDTNTIKDSNIYHTDIKKEYLYNTTNNSIISIKEFIMLLKYKNLINIKHNYNTLNDIIIKNNKNHKEILYEYCVNNNSSFIILSIDNENYKIESNNIVYKNEISLTGKQINILLFFCNHKYSYTQRLKQLKNIYESDELYKVSIYIFDLIESIEFETLKNNTSIFIFNNLIDKIKISSFMFNDNTLDIIKNDEYWNYDINDNIILKENQTRKLLNYNTLLKFVYNTWNIKIIENLYIKINDNKFDIFINDNENPILIKKIIKMKPNMINEIIYNKLELKNIKLYKSDGLKFII